MLPIKPKEATFKHLFPPIQLCVSLGQAHFVLTKKLGNEITEQTC